MNAIYYGEIIDNKICVFKKNQAQSGSHFSDSAADIEIRDPEVLKVAIKALLDHPNMANGEFVFGQVNPTGNRLIDEAVNSAGGVTAYAQRQRWTEAANNTLEKIRLIEDMNNR